MLTRVARRRHEHAIRLALGATRGAIARLWLAEILVVACAGGALGLLFAHWLSVAIVALAPDDLPRLNDVSVDATVAFFTFAAVVAVALVTGAMPLRQAGAASLIEAFDGARTTSSRQALRTRSILLVAQIGLSVVLLVAAGLVVRSFMAVRQIDLGFTADRVLSLKVQPGNPNTLVNPWIRDFLLRVRAVPGVEAAGAVYLRPLMLGPIGDGVGRPSRRPAGNDCVSGRESDTQPSDSDPWILRGAEDPTASGTFLHRSRHGRDAACGDRQRVDGEALVAGTESHREAVVDGDVHATLDPDMGSAHHRRRRERRAVSRNRRSAAGHLRSGAPGRPRRRQHRRARLRAIRGACWPASARSRASSTRRRSSTR